MLGWKTATIVRSQTYVVDNDANELAQLIDNSSAPKVSGDSFSVSLKTASVYSISIFEYNELTRSGFETEQRKVENFRR